LKIILETIMNSIQILRIVRSRMHNFLGARAESIRKLSLLEGMENDQDSKGILINF